MGGTMTAGDLRDFTPEWVEPISTAYRGWTVYELPPNTQGIAALMMLNMMEHFPLAEYGFHSARALHVMIEAKKLAYADMLRYVGDVRFSRPPVGRMLDKTHGACSREADRTSQRRLRREPSFFGRPDQLFGARHQVLSVIDRSGNVVSPDPEHLRRVRRGHRPARRRLRAPQSAAPCLRSRTDTEAGRASKAPLHTIIPGFMQRGETRIGFGIMGGFNQAQAHAQFVANIADYGMDIQQALEAGRFTKSTFTGADVNIEALVPEPVRNELVALGHEVTVVPPRTGTFGHGQALIRNDTGVHFGASEPRHDTRGDSGSAELS
jgi:gamma-glutamyltranspeptidase/glutathione hydrolase